MSRKLGHPAPTDLSRLRAGVPGGRQGRRLAAHIARCPDCARVYAQLDAVSVTLREAPRAPLPAPVERRILVAMAAEAARRQAGHPGGGRHARRRLSVPFPRSLPVMVAPAIAGALLVFAGFGYLLSSIRTNPPSPIPAVGPPASVTTGPAFPGIGVADGPSGTGGSTVPPGGVTMTSASGVSHANAFLVTDSSITYQKATLRAQVRHALAVQTSAPVVRQVQPSATPATILTASPGDAGPSPVPDTPGRGSSSGGAIAAKVAPSRALVGCVLHLTGDVPPMFVDRARYQAEQVYVIAVAAEAWVVGIDCTASRPTLITLVQLTSAR